MVGLKNMPYCKCLKINNLYNPLDGYAPRRGIAENKK
jgi:hypothetical protein